MVSIVLHREYTNGSRQALCKKRESVVVTAFQCLTSWAVFECLTKCKAFKSIFSLMKDSEALLEPLIAAQKVPWKRSLTKER